MATTWPGLAALLSDSVPLIDNQTLVMLGIPDKKRNFRVVGAVFADSQETLIRDILHDGGIAFSGGDEYNPFSEVINDSSSGPSS